MLVSRSYCFCGKCNFALSVSRFLSPLKARLQYRPRRTMQSQLDELRSARHRLRVVAALDEYAAYADTRMSKSAVEEALERAEADLLALDRTRPAASSVIPILLSPHRDRRTASIDVSSRFRLSAETERRCAAAAKVRPFFFFN